MADETLFDRAWDEWRRAVTAALTPASGAISPHARMALEAVDAFDPTDGLITRDWALGLMTDEGDHVGQLAARGLSAGEVARLVELIQRHPPPAAGG